MKQPLGSCNLTAGSGTVTIWECCHGSRGAGGATNLFGTRNYMDYAGTIYVTTFVVSAAPGVGNSFIVDVMLNGVSAATGTISGAATSVSINANFAVVAGDYITHRFTQGGTPTAAQARIGMYLDDGGNSFLIFHTSGTASAAATRFQALTGEGSLSTTEVCQGYMDAPGNVTSLRVNLSVAPGAGTSRIYEVFVNGVGSGLIATISGAATSAVATGSIAVVQGDFVSTRHTVTGAPAGAAYAIATVLTASTEGLAQFINCNVTAATGAESAYPDHTTSGAARIGANVASFQSNLSSHAIYRTVAPGLGKSITATIMVNEVSSGVTLTISGTATSQTSTSTVTLAADDRVRYDITVVGVAFPSGILKCVSSGPGFAAVTGGSACLV